MLLFVVHHNAIAMFVELWFFFLWTGQFIITASIFLHLNEQQIFMVTITQTNKWSVSPTVRQSLRLSVSQSVNQSVSHPVNQSVSQSVSETVSQWVSESVCQWVSLSVSQSVSQSFCQSVSQSIHLRVHQSNKYLKTNKQKQSNRYNNNIPFLLQWTALPLRQFCKTNTDEEPENH